MGPISGDLCAICGERLFSPYPVSQTTAEPRCALCRRMAPKFARAVAYGSYEGGLRELIHLLKYSGVLPAVSVLGRMLGEAIAELQRDFGAEPVIVVPVPLFRGRRRSRGFNQAELITRAALKNLGAPSQLRLGERVLVRTRETLSQTGLTRHERRENMRGAFAVAKPEEIAGQQVLVVDDVFTTGATVSECARVLLRAGAAKVWIATVARTLRESEQHAEILRGADASAEEGFEVQEVSMAKAVGS